MAKIIWDQSPFDVRAGLYADGQIICLPVWRPDAPPLFGAQFNARVISLQAAQGMAFLDAGLGAPLFLPLKKDMALKEGQMVLVEIIRDAEPGKNAMARLLASDVTAQIGLAQAALSPGQSLLRDYSHAELWAATPFAAAAMRQALKEIGQKDRPVRIIGPQDHDFIAALDDAYTASFEAVIPLPHGARLILEETAGFIALDVDAGAAAASGGYHSLRARTAEHVNRAAFDEGLRQASLRALGGLFVMDVLRMPRAAQAAFENHVRERLAALTDAAYGGLNRLGLLSFSLPKQGPSLMARRRAVDGMAYAAGDMLRQAARLGYPAHIQAGARLAPFLMEHADLLASAWGSAVPVTASDDLDPLGWRFAG